MRRTITHFFPNLYARLENVCDPRQRHDYTMTEILLAALFMFIAKQDSRNAMNNDRQEPLFAQNYENLFGKRLPHMDTVNDVLVAITNDELEHLKASLVATLIEKKVFNKFRMASGHLRVAIDATGVVTVKQGHCKSCLHKTSKNGVTTHFHNLLEAKLITPNGFAISLASEWIENSGDYDKQDCELNAFKRLAWKLKKFFPRLRICIHADSLYPNKPFFDLCRQNAWAFIVTLKDGSLKSLWENIDADLLVSKNFKTRRKKNLEQKYRWLTGLSYQDQNLSWIECIETCDGETRRFVYLTSLDVDGFNVVELASSGRMRFKIENEGFNTQKNLGYNLSHMFSRKSAEAMKNYVSLMQIAHLINQLYELSSVAKPQLQGKITIKYLWKRLLSALLETVIPLLISSNAFQIRYE